MLIRHLRIRNFRSIRSLDLDLGDTTVLIGPNNAGKTAILEAVRIALSRRWGQRGTGFTEYDVHLCDERADPKTSDPVVIEVELQELEAGEWPEDLKAELEGIIQSDAVEDRSSIILRVSCCWDVVEGSYVPRWEFLNVERQPLVGRATRAVNLQEFFQYLPVFYLEALRDVDQEFSSRSQFWGRLLRAVAVPDSLERRAKRVFDALNRRFLAADPRLGTLADTLSSISRVAAGDGPGTADLRVVPLRSWDLLSRAEVIYRCEVDKPWLPLPRHGQGVQSLSVMFLFRAFVEQLLADLYKPDSTPVLALEEPETHLHPQAARMLWRHISELPGQKLVTTHSPYFLQHVPFRDLRVIRLGPNGTTVASLPASFKVIVPHISALDAVLSSSGGKLAYDRSLGELVVHGILHQSHYRALLTAFAGHADKATIHAALRRLNEASQLFIPDDELEQLETFARRVRGEIFFARRWLLVEGTSEYLIARGIGSGLEYDFDEHGVSVIDVQNNGNPQCFAALARALNIPWLAVFDGDGAGEGYPTQIGKRGFTDTEVAARCVCLPAGDLEQQLVADGLQPELRAILTALGKKAGDMPDDDALVKHLRKSKTAYAAMLSRQCSTDKALASRMPAPFRNAIAKMPGLT